MISTQWLLWFTLKSYKQSSCSLMFDLKYYIKNHLTSKTVWLADIIYVNLLTNNLKRYELFTFIIFWICLNFKSKMILTSQIYSRFSIVKQTMPRSLMFRFEMTITHPFVFINFYGVCLFQMSANFHHPGLKKLRFLFWVWKSVNINT